MDIDELESIAENVAEQLDDHIGKLGKFALNIRNTKFPSTNLALFSFIPKVESIRSGIFELARAGEVYSEKILFRSICEHFLKFKYIVTRFTEDKNDDIGKEYFIFCGAQEELNFAKSLKKRASVLGEKIDIDPLEILKKYQPILKNESNRSINKIADQFKHKNMVEYVTKILDSEKETPNPFLPNIIPAYSELSSFVHGGPSTQRDSDICADQRLAEKTLIKDAMVALQMSLSVRSFAFLLFSLEDKDMLSLFKVIDKNLKSLPRLK